MNKDLLIEAVKMLNEYIEQNPRSPYLFDELEKNINEINLLSIYELVEKIRFYNLYHMIFGTIVI